MTRRPTGTVTFLFTDIEGSTKLWEEHHDWMDRAHKRQEQIIRDSVARHHGYAYKMIGDAFQIAFVTARDALDAAIEAQRALLDVGNWKLEVGKTTRTDDAASNLELPTSNLQLKVRMALHTGVTEERGDDYVGPVLNRVARLMSAGHGGQILVSDVTQGLLRDHLPQNVTLRDMGERHLKDLIRAEHVHQVAVPDLPSDFPPLQTLDTLPNNLPIQLTSFIGRKKEIEEIKKLLATTHLLTLTGVGGTGKTRLSLQVAADVLDEYKDGVWLIELAPLADPMLVPQTVATVLRLREEGKPLVEILLEYLRAKNLLLILDNCEHLIDACAQFTDTILQHARGVRILASSREALGIAAETTFRVPSLQIPDLKEQILIPNLQRCEAVRLFTDRAFALQSEFRLTSANASAVAQICHRLDGIPLAIELAAARVKALKPQEIAARLDDRFRLLTGGSRTALPRQQTLRAAIDWSYSLLSELERVLLRRLSVFVGGCSLVAAEEVCAGDGIAREGILDLLTRLADKSMLMVDSSGEATRYKLLETIRQYARDRLLDSGEGERVREKHLEFFVTFAERVDQEIRGLEQAVWLDRVESEHDNLRAAIGWGLERGDVELVLRLSDPLAYFWNMHGYHSEGRQWLERIIELSRQMAGARLVSSQYRALFGRGLSRLGQFAYFLGDYAIARERAEEGLELSRKVGEKRGMFIALFTLGSVALELDDFAVAQAIDDERLALAREFGFKPNISLSLVLLGDLALIQADYATALARYEEGLGLAREIGGKGYIAEAIAKLGHMALNQGDYVAARSRYTEGLALVGDLGFKYGIAICLVGWAGLAAAKAQMDRATRLSSAVEALFQVIGSRMNKIERKIHERTLTAARAQLDEATFDAAWNEGRAMSLEQAVEYALEGDHAQ